MKTALRILIILAAAYLAGAALLQPPAGNRSVILIDSNKVAAAFAKGMPIIETNSFKVQAGRREAPGIAEIHTRDTDIFYILEGSGVFVTGGKAIEPKPVGPDEFRAPQIEGGDPRQIKKGDVIIIPNGIPHWFKEVNGPLLYYVVKVTAPRE